MYLRLFLALFLFKSSCDVAQAQIQWTERFSNQNFSHPISWIGDTSDFMVNQVGHLQLNASSSTVPLEISTRSKVIDRSKWEFYLKLDFSPSSSNYAEVYLCSDHSDPEQAMNAYFLKIGGISGSNDDISLYKRINGIDTKIIDGTDGLAGGSIVALNVRIEKDSAHQWILLLDTNLNGNFFHEGTAIDSSIIQSNFFSIRCKFTSTRSNKFFFDDIEVSGYAFQDTLPIKVLELELADSNKLHLSFSEIPSTPGVYDKSNYQLLNAFNSLDTIYFDQLDSSSLYLEYDSKFDLGKTIFIELSGISDKEQNVMKKDTLSFLFFQVEQAVFSDVLINEIYPDPTPSNGLPESEYIELYNRSKKFISIENWIIKDRDVGGLVPKFILRPNQFVLLCEAKDTSRYNVYGECLGLNYFPSLNNGGDHLELLDDARQLIHSMDYNQSTGGQSIELINPHMKCMDELNYNFSVHPEGGTPLAENSLFDTLPDKSPPQLISYHLEMDSILKLTFSEIIDSTVLSSASLKLNLEQLKRPKISSDGKMLSTVSKGFPKGYELSLILDSIYDCEGNAIFNMHQKIVFPAEAVFGDVVINEVLFNPLPGGSDFVELFNTSSRIFDLSNWWISNSDTSGKEMIGADQLLMFPSDYLVLTKDLHFIEETYLLVDRTKMVEVKLPAFNDDEGAVILLSADLALMDRIDYSEEMHFDLISDPEGVSLERIDPFRPSEWSNFFSASEFEGSATPTRENSQLSRSGSIESKFKLRSKIISPDQDEYEDLLFLDFVLEKQGYIGSVEVYDSFGRRIKKLVNNELLPPNGTIIWDGLNEELRKPSVGIYMLFIELLDLNGNIERAKIPFVIAAKLK